MGSGVGLCRRRQQAVQKTGGQAATLLLQHLRQEPMPIIEEHARVQGCRKGRKIMEAKI
jgi:hypothetical protein